MLLSTPLIAGDLDFCSLREKGFATGRVSDLMSQALLAHVLKEEFIPDFESKHGDGYQPSETDYQAMYVAKDRMGDRPGGFYEVWLDHVMAWARPYVGMYMNMPTGMDAHLAISEGRQGYYMDWHHDVGERAVAIALLYLCEGDIQPEHGGELEVSRVTRDANGAVVSRVITGRITPRHGELVLIDASSLLFEHRVREFTGDSFSRFFLSATLGIPRE